MPGMLWMAMVRPPYVHATIELDRHAPRRRRCRASSACTPARTSSLGALPFVWPITEDIKIPVHYPLATDKIRFAGDAVAVVVAETREQAEDAAEVVSIEATELPAVTDLGEAAKDEVDRSTRTSAPTWSCTGATAARATRTSSSRRR